MKTAFATIFLITYLSFLLKPFLPEIEYEIENDLCSPELIHTDVCEHKNVADLKNSDLCFIEALQNSLDAGKHARDKKATPSTQIQIVNIVHVSTQEYFLPKELDTRNRKFSDLSFFIKDITIDIPTPPPKC